MPFPIEERFILEAEQRLGISLPLAYRKKLMRENGGQLETPPDSWTLYPVRDSSDRKRLKRTCNDIVLETENARRWTGFPRDSVAIGANGGGDRLILRPNPADSSVLSSEVAWWDHETGAINPIGDIAAIL